MSIKKEESHIWFWITLFFCIFIAYHVSSYRSEIASLKEQIKVHETKEWIMNLGPVGPPGPPGMPGPVGKCPSPPKETKGLP
jgi:hypothetical protein